MRPHPDRILAASVLGAALIAGHPASATTVTVTLPTVTASPGTSVNVPITLSQSLVGLGVQSIQFHLPFDPAKVTGASETGTGVVDTWGTPFSFTTATQYSVAAAGIAPVTSASTLLETVQLTISPTATVPSDQPLTLTSFLFNEGTPAATVVAGVVHIRAATGVEAPWGAEFAMRDARPNPARGPVAIEFSLPAAALGGTARLSIYGLDGRAVRTLAAGVGGGPHLATWDLLDARGVKASPGLYFARLEWAGRSLTRRFVLLR